MRDQPHGRTRYPPPRLPMLPSISPAFAGRQSNDAFTSAFWQDGAVWCARGCDALVLVLRAAGMTGADRILVPAFHCPSVPAAVRGAGMQPDFYRINANLTPVMEDVGRQLQDGARALLLIHYFGFRQDAEPYRRLCDQHGALLIEDCAHTFFGRSGDPLPGALGHYAIASTRKLFPLPDGGAAISASGDLDQHLLSPVSWADEGRCVLSTIQRAADADRLGFLSRPTSGTLSYIDRLRRTSAARSRLTTDSAPGRPGGTPGGTTLRKMSRVARHLMRLTDIERLTRVRRLNYTALLRGSRSFRGCTPLFPELPPDTVPYVFPLILREPARMFPALKNRRVPIFRWEHIDGLGCPVTDAYEAQLIQLPCHQELAPEDIEWILEELHQVAGSHR